MESATRDVIFRLRAEPAKDAQQKLKAFATFMEQTQKRVHQQRRRFALEESRTAATAVRDRIMGRQREASIVDRMLSEEQRSRQRVHRDQLHRISAIEQATKRSTERQERFVTSSINARERAIASAHGKLRAAHSTLGEGLGSAGESLVRLTSGLATVGLMSEDNTEKLLRQLVVIRGTNDVLAGSINLYLRLTKVVQGYRATLAAVESVETALATKRALMGSGALGGVAGRGLRRQGMRLAGDIAGGVAGGVAEGVAERGLKRSFSRTLIREGTELAGGAAAGAAGGLAAQSGLTGLQRFTLGASRALGGLQAAASAAAVPLTILAGGATIFDMLRTGSVKPEEGSVRGGVVGGLGSVHGFAPRMLAKVAPDFMLRGASGLAGLPLHGGSFGSIASAELSSRAVGRSEAELKDALSKEQRRRSMLETQLAVLQLDVQAKLSEVVSKAERFAGRPGIEAIDRAQEHLRFQGFRISQVDTSRDPQARLQQMQQLLAIAQQMVSLSDKRKQDQIIELQARREIVTKDLESLKLRREAAQEEIRGTKEALDNTRQRIREIKARLLGAEVRFSQMDPIEQKRALAIGRKAKANQAAIGKIDASIEAARFRKALLSSAPPAVGDPAETFARSKTLSALDKTLADLEEKRKQRELTRKERDVLLGIGTPEAERLAKESARRDARRSGFGEIVGEEQRQLFVDEGVAAWKAQILENQMRQDRELSVQVEGLKDIAIKFDTDEDAIRRAIKEGTAEEWERLQAIVEETHRAEIAALREANARRDGMRRANASG